MDKKSNQVTDKKKEKNKIRKSIDKNEQDFTAVRKLQDEYAQFGWETQKLMDQLRDDYAAGRSIDLFSETSERFSKDRQQLDFTMEERINELRNERQLLDDKLAESRIENGN